MTTPSYIVIEIEHHAQHSRMRINDIDAFQKDTVHSKGRPYYVNNFLRLDALKIETRPMPNTAYS